MSQPAIHICHLLDRHVLQCQWREPNGSRCPTTFETSAKNRKYCDMHRHENHLQQATNWMRNHRKKRRVS